MRLKTAHVATVEKTRAPEERTILIIIIILFAILVGSVLFLWNRPLGQVEDKGGNQIDLNTNRYKSGVEK